MEPVFAPIRLLAGTGFTIAGLGATCTISTGGATSTVMGRSIPTRLPESSYVQRVVSVIPKPFGSYKCRESGTLIIAVAGI